MKILETKRSYREGEKRKDAPTCGWSAARRRPVQRSGRYAFTVARNVALFTADCDLATRLRRYVLTLPASVPKSPHKMYGESIIDYENQGKSIVDLFHKIDENITSKCQMTSFPVSARSSKENCLNVFTLHQERGKDHRVGKRIRGDGSKN